jgi:hypothetical protein
MVRAAVMLLLAAFPAASAFLPLITPGRFAPPLARNSGVSALRSPVRHARGVARGAVQLRAAGDDGLLEKIDAEAFEILLQVAGPYFLVATHVATPEQSMYRRRNLSLR